MSYFSKLKEGDKTYSAEHGIVSVLMVEQRNSTRFVTCQTLAECEDEQITFDAIEGELRQVTWIDELPELNHCYCDYTLRKAVQMVVNNGQIHSTELSNITEVKDYLAENIRYCTHVWITGQRAMELITAYIENKPVKDVAIP